MRNLYEHMYVAKVVFDFFFFGQLTGRKNKNAEPLWTHVRREGRFRFLLLFGQVAELNKKRLRNLCEHMYVAKAVFDFYLVGQLIGLKHKNAEPLWTHVRREGRFRFLIVWPADWAKK